MATRTRTRKNAFIFQSIAEQYDQRVKLKPGRRENWEASRYWRAMRPSDIVYFWMDGPDDIRGVYGWGSLMAKPRPVRGYMAVPVTVKHVFSTPLLATIIRQDRILSKLMILKAPRAANFLLSQAQAVRLALLVHRHGEQPPEAIYGKPQLTTATKRRDAIFVSYSHTDDYWQKRLEVHLAPLTRKHPQVVWSDKRIKPGQLWKKEIARAMASAKVAVLLISADFLASEFIMKNELPGLLAAALADGAVILSVIVGPCRFWETKSISKFQSVNDPKKPLSAMKSHAQEKTFYRVSIAVEAALGTAKKAHD